MNGALTEKSIKQWAGARHLPSTHLTRWLGFEETDRAALLEAARKLRLHTGQFVAALEMLAEIGVREGIGIAAVLACPPIRRILAAGGSGPGRARAFMEELRAIRYPRLKRAAERLRTETKALGLPRGVNVILPTDLASDELRIEIRASGGVELERLLGAVTASVKGLVRIAQLLGGDGEL